MPQEKDSRQYIKIRGANEHNLKNVDVDIPRDKLVVLTGLSGSGKKSDRLFSKRICGRTEKIYGIIVFLCQTVPGTDGKTGCRKYRRIVSGYFH